MKVKEIALGVLVALLVFEFIMFGVAVARIMSGYHTIDLLSDVRTLIHTYKGNESDFGECTLAGECTTLTETYRQGWLMLFSGVQLAVPAAAAFAVNLTLLILFFEGEINEQRKNEQRKTMANVANRRHAPRKLV